MEGHCRTLLSVGLSLLSSEGRISVVVLVRTTSGWSRPAAESARFSKQRDPGTAHEDTTGLQGEFSSTSSNNDKFKEKNMTIDGLILLYFNEDNINIILRIKIIHF